MTNMKVCLLGAPYIELDGEPVNFDTRKATALLAYLAETGERSARDTLATLLWPDYDQSRARAAFRRTLSTLNRALDGQHLDITREVIALIFDDSVRVDTHIFRELHNRAKTHSHPEGGHCPTCIQDLEEAASLYHADFMAGFTLRDSVSFDDWQFYQSESLRRELVAILEKLVEYHCQQHTFDRAIEHGQRWLAFDPLREEAHRWLMKAFEWAGQHNAALVPHHRCSIALHILKAEQAEAVLRCQRNILSDGSVVSFKPLG